MSQSSLPALPILHSPREENEVLGRIIRQRAAAGGKLRILEAGCGLAWEIDMHGISHTLVGVDMDRDALEIRKTRTRDLHEAVLGDLRSVPLEPGSFDIVFNSFVLEHIRGAEGVLDNFWRWLKPGGILILRLPDRASVYGFMTRITPFWFHVLFKKHVEGVKDAGKPGCVPFPTFYDGIVSRRGIRDWCRKTWARVPHRVRVEVLLRPARVLALAADRLAQPGTLAVARAARRGPQQPDVGHRKAVAENVSFLAACGISAVLGKHGIQGQDRHVFPALLVRTVRIACGLPEPGRIPGNPLGNCPRRPNSSRKDRWGTGSAGSCRWPEVPRRAASC